MTNVLIDTSLWSLMLRRRGSAVLSEPQRDDVRHIHELLRSGSAMLIGAIRQELLTGIRAPSQFAAVQEGLLGARELAMPLAAYDQAASCANRCIEHGVAIEKMDLLLCAASIIHGVSIWANDGDFARYAAVLTEMPRCFVVR